MLKTAAIKQGHSRAATSRDPYSLGIQHGTNKDTI